MSISTADAMSSQPNSTPSQDQVQAELQPASASSSELQPPPINLPRNEAGTHVIWSQGCRVEFEEWWGQKTTWGQNATQSVARHKLITWGSVSRHNTEMWARYLEGADVGTGKPAVICQQCARVLEHPGVSGTGTNGMKKHARSKGCGDDQVRQTVMPQVEQKAPSASHSQASLTTAVQPVPATMMLQESSPLFQQADLEYRLAAMFVNGKLPSEFVENQALVKVFRMLCPGVELPSVERVHQLIRQRKKALKKKSKEKEVNMKNPPQEQRKSEMRSTSNELRDKTDSSHADCMEVENLLDAQRSPTGVKEREINEMFEDEPEGESNTKTGEQIIVNDDDESTSRDDSTAPHLVRQTLLRTLHSSSDLPLLSEGSKSRKRGLRQMRDDLSKGEQAVLNSSVHKPKKRA